MADIWKQHSIYLDIVLKLSELSRCRKLKVGAIIVKGKRIISHGINGTPEGFENCEDVFSKIETKEEIKKHHEWSKKNEIHAEMNAIINACKEHSSVNGASIYCNYEPCDQCLKNLVAANIKTIYFDSLYSFNSFDHSIPYMERNKVNAYQRINGLFERVSNAIPMD